MAYITLSIILLIQIYCDSNLSNIKIAFSFKTDKMENYSFRKTERIYFQFSIHRSILHINVISAANSMMQLEEPVRRLGHFLFVCNKRDFFKRFSLPRYWLPEYVIVKKAQIRVTKFSWNSTIQQSFRLTVFLFRILS